MNIADFVAQQQRLLGLEQQAERAQVERLLQQSSDAELQARGVSLVRLIVQDLEPGYGGRLHAILAPSHGGELPAHRLAAGDLVALREQRDRPPAATGVVVRTRRDRLIVALDDDDAELPPLLRLDQLASDVTWRRLDAALRTLLIPRRGEDAHLQQVLFGERDPAFAPPRPLTFCDPTLDDSQRAAVEHALAAENIALIHGPPGTGKTTAVVEFIRQCALRRERVLACAPANVAVDNLAERLAAAGLRIVRLGHPARVLDSVKDHTLAEQLANAEEQGIRKDLRRELDQLTRKLHRCTRRDERRQLRDELKRLRREDRDLEAAIARGLVDGADVVLATLTGAADMLLSERTFDRVVIDEAAQALEAACWIALPRARRVLLAGDHRQLPPTIRSEQAATQGLATTLFERLALGPHGALLSRPLTVQYRMHAAIQTWSAATFYDGRLQPAAAVAGHRLCDLPGVTTGAFTEAPLVFLDTAGCGHEETPGDEDGSKANPGEAALVTQVVRDLLDHGVPATAIGVITPYNAQVHLLRGSLGGVEGLEIGTVDGFQGREKEAIVLSLVRSNEAMQIGFLGELRRLNVAVTRARRLLCIVGDSATISSEPGLASLVETVQQVGVWRSAFELGPG
ncbi:MAG: AAA family ATPase [Planctomycetes bacterium]|nr:AAA family ATPase [Planctomycetota bacterium]